MVMPYGLMKTTCESCGWACLTNQRSDVVMAPNRCGRCSGTRLRHIHASGRDCLNPLLWLRGRFIR